MTDAQRQERDILEDGSVAPESHNPERDEGTRKTLEKVADLGFEIASLHETEVGRNKGAALQVDARRQVQQVDRHDAENGRDVELLQTDEP